MCARNKLYVNKYIYVRAWVFRNYREPSETVMHSNLLPLVHEARFFSVSEQERYRFWHIESTEKIFMVNPALVGLAEAISFVPRNAGGYVHAFTM
ncbi:MAG: hypothetical protein G01um101429_523 [Parcubacteria group bacterium Gr01-1014_29]|nr:MAG: hypothetical protein G01um101429_523 [Parcubacteria group bacterium Gr01-1014_29]